MGGERRPARQSRGIVGKNPKMCLPLDQEVPKRGWGGGGQVNPEKVVVQFLNIPLTTAVMVMLLLSIFEHNLLSFILPRKVFTNGC